MKTKKNLFALMLLVVLSACRIDSEEPAAFISSILRINKDEVQDLLNIEPHLILPLKYGIVCAELDGGDVVIKSLMAGNTSVYVSNEAGFCNSAIIDIFVDKNGKISANVSPFEGELVKAVIKNNTAISGIIGKEIAPIEFFLMMDGNVFYNVESGMDASSWILNLPSGLQSVICFVQGGEFPHEVKIAVSGTPLEAYSGEIVVNIPAQYSGMGWSVFVDRNDNAMFNIVDS
ncbi:MAG: hypothetical protein FWH41_00500 [Treponema sp.]|nr:hypothetical protein [Treponema sp.]